VRLENGVEEVFDGVVAASGHQSDPRDPPEVKEFAGQYLHAHDYRVPEPFSGKRVLVIGPGNSGVDVAADLCSVTEHTVLCARSPVLIMPRMIFGKPQSRTLVLLEKPWVPWPFRIWTRALLTRIVRERHAGCEEGVVLDLRVLSDIAVAVDLDVVTEAAAVVDDGVAPDRHVVADRQLAIVVDPHVAPDLGAGADGRAPPPHEQTWGGPCSA